MTIDIRCLVCGKKQGVASVFIGAIRCNRCKKISEFKIVPNLTVNELYDPKYLQSVNSSDTMSPATHESSPTKGQIELNAR